MFSGWNWPLPSSEGEGFIPKDAILYLEPITHKQLSQREANSVIFYPFNVLKKLSIRTRSSSGEVIPYEFVVLCASRLHHQLHGGTFHLCLFHCSISFQSWRQAGNNLITGTTVYGRPPHPEGVLQGYIDLSCGQMSHCNS